MYTMWHQLVLSNTLWAPNSQKHEGSDSPPVYILPKSNYLSPNLGRIVKFKGTESSSINLHTQSPYELTVTPSYYDEKCKQSNIGRYNWLLPCCHQCPGAVCWKVVELSPILSESPCPFHHNACFSTICYFSSATIDNSLRDHEQMGHFFYGPGPGHVL